MGYFNNQIIEIINFYCFLGVLLARIVKQVNPNVLFVNLNERPLTKKSAIQNLEQVSMFKKIAVLIPYFIH